MPVRLAQAFATCTRERVQVLVVLSDGVLFNYRSQIGVLALRHRLPAISSVSEYAEAGLLLAYGPDLRDLFRRAAAFVDEIFKGAKPADLPIEQPIKYELVLNLKTAKALPLDVPGSILARADEVIDECLPVLCTFERSYV
jgi:putative ABC transport system substrate-binding protein